MSISGQLATWRPLAAILLIIAVASASCAADSPVPWLRSAGDDLQIRLAGEVFDSGGAPAQDVAVSGGFNSELSSQPPVAAVTGNRFEIWIPINKYRPFSLWMKAASDDGQRVAYKQLNAFELRQAAIEGLRMTLQTPPRRVAVRVIDDGAPVANANVKAELGFGVELRERTDEHGVARFGLLSDQELSGLMAWTDDPRVGGYSFHRKPQRDPAADEFEIELSDCRDQKLRFVDESGAPISGLAFRAQIATAPPEYNFIGTNEHSRQITDSAGEAVLKWFPDWEDHHFYVDLRSEGWIADDEPEIDGDSYVFELTRGKPRQRFEGRVELDGFGAGGFNVTLQSFEAERENYVDRLTAFTSADGSFTVDVLPGATYCAYVNDPRWVSEIVDLMPYDPETNQTSPLALNVVAGQKVQFVATTGPDRKPYENLSISLRREHNYSWRENGEVQNGTSGPQWWVTTDSAGLALAYTLPGKLSASVYTPLWRDRQERNIAAGQDVTMELHRAVEAKRQATGRVVLEKGIEADLAGAVIKAGAVDGNFDETLTIPCDENGEFSFEMMASEIGIFAYTRDGRAAGSTVVKDLREPIELKLDRTVDYQGQLLGQGDKPLAGHGVRAIVRVEGEEDYDAMFIKSFEATRIEATTDAMGHFTLRGVPGRMKTYIQADALDDATSTTHLDEVFLEPDESRPRSVSRLASGASANPLPLAERFANARRDAALGGFRVMVILRAGGDEVAEFVTRNFVEYDMNKDVSAYMQIVVAGPATDLTEADAEFLAQQEWELPAEGQLAAYALDADGRELGRLDLDAADPASAQRAADFIHEHAPSPVDAEEKWREAFDEARRTNRRVWARHSQRYCGPCFRLSRWLDDHRDLLAKDYVMLKIDNVRDVHGVETVRRLTQGNSHGVPFHAIFDANEQMLVDSAGPLGNVGHPSGYEGQKQLRKMLQATRLQLTDTEIDELVISVGD